MKKTNTLKNHLKIIVYTLVISFVLQSCSSDDDNATKATVNYLANAIDASFYVEGNSVPTVNWNGDTGTFRLIESYADGIQGLTLNETTGELNWTKFLQEGIWIFDVEATNSAGTTIVEMTIDNTLKGVFTGIYDTASFFEMEFSKDGTVEIRANNADDPELATGTWTINNEFEVTVNYTYTNTGQEYSTLGTLLQTEANASYSGNWYYNHDTIEGDEGGTYSLAKDN